MTFGRKFGLAAAGIVVLGGASAWLVDLAGGPGVLRLELPGGAPSAEPSGGALPPLPAPTGGAPAEAPPPPANWAPPPAPVQERLPPPPKDSWDATPVTARAATLGRLGGAISRELQELQPAVSACFDELAQARHGRDAPSTVDYAPAEEAGSVVLVLQLETLADAVRIVDAPVETRAKASDGLIACAQAALRGKQLPAPGSRPGQRYRLRFSVAP